MGTLLPDFPDVEELKLPEDIESGKVGHSALGFLHGKIIIIIIIILLPQNVSFCPCFFGAVNLYY